MNQENREAQCSIDIDVMDRIKREAHHKKISHKVLLNQILRDAVFKTKKSRKEERILEKPYCPECGFDLLKGKAKKEKSTDRLEPSSKNRNWKNLFGLIS